VSRAWQTVRRAQRVGLLSEGRDLSHLSRRLIALATPLVCAALVLAALRVWPQLPWERSHATTAALVALLIAARSVRVSAGRVRRVRAWITFGFGAWAASQLVTDLGPARAGASTTNLSLALLGGVLIAAGGAYWVDLHGRVSRRAEMAVYLDAAIVGAAVTALLVTWFGGSAIATPALLPLVIHAIVFLGVLGAALILNLAVLAEVRLDGAYAILLGLGLIGFGFVGRTAGLGDGLAWSMPLLVSAGVLVVAFGTASWSDRVDENPIYARIAERLRGWLPLAAVAVTLLVLFVAPRDAHEPLQLVFDLAAAVVLLGTVARQSVLLNERDALLAETSRWSEQLERIQALSAELSRSRALAAVADAVADHIESVIDWHGLRLYVLAADGETLEPIKLCSKHPHYARETADLVRFRLGQGLGGHIALSGIAEVINDAAHDPRVSRVPGSDDVDESMIVVPLSYEDQVLGVLEVFRLGLDAFDATDLRLAQIVAAQAAVALSNARQLEELERRGDALERRLASQRQLLAITERLLIHRERGAVFEAVADTLAEVVPHDTLTIYLVDHAAACLVPILARDEYAEQILASRPALGAGITGDVISRGEAEIINDAAYDPRVVHVPGTPADQNDSMIVAPIRSPEGVIGALNLYRASRHFDGEDLELVRLFTNHVAIALENAAIHDRLLDAAVTDPLTGLPNRRLFAERIDQALARRGRAGGHLAVLFLDLDSFKLVNDGLGHAAGDAVLRAVADRLRDCTRTADTVARLGGDEFGILLEDVTSESYAVIASERVVLALSSPLSLDGRVVSVRASIGVALDRGDERKTSVELLRDADTAMYRAKANARGGFEIFESSMHARQLARLELDSDLREAMGRGQFALVYQPIVTVATGRVVATEALLRWHHPTRAIGPHEFIRIAEESGQIVPLGMWVLREACRQGRRWQLERPAAHDLRISVNTSARELMEGDFVEGVETALSDSGLGADSLALEITESMMLADETTAISALRRLRAAGIHILVDDFGTGYSSLSYLKRLPVDGLKIDRSFIEGLGREREKTAIVRATIAFARALGLAVTAEGIETEDQFRRLIALGCDLGQGYHFAAPLEPAAMTELLESGRRYSLPGRRPRTHRDVRAA